MTISEEIIKLEIDLEQAFDKKEQADILISILKKSATLISTATGIYIRYLMDIANQLNDPIYLGWGYYYRAAAHFAEAEFEQAQNNYEKATTFFDSGNHKVNQAACYHNIGNTFYYRSNYLRALEYYLKALKLREEAGAEFAIGASYNCIGNVYYDQGDLSVALEYYLNAIKIEEAIGSKHGIALSYKHAGTTYFKQANYISGIEYLQKSIAPYEEIGDKIGLGSTYHYLGELYEAQQNLPSALNYYLKSLTLNKEVSNKRGLCYSFNAIGRLFILQQQLESAADYLAQGIEIAQATGMRNEKKDALYSLYKLSKLQNDSPTALLYLEQFLELDRELRNEETTRRIAALKYEHEIQQKGKQLEIEQIRNVELKHERDRAEQSEKFKEQFLANMSHEIRTPMNAVLGITNLLIDTPLNEKQKKYLFAVKKSSENLLVILNDILDLSKLEAGKMELEKSPFRLADQVAYAMDIMRFKAEERGLAFSCEIAADVPAVVIGDAPRLNQILINLLSNAIKFTAKGWVKLKVINAGNSKLKYVIADTGIGMTAQQQTKIFESFTQAENNTSRKYGGTGLGLTICKTLVELQGGNIVVKSEPGRGSEFSFTISYPVGDEKDIDTSHKVSETDYYALSKLKLLVAEDYEFNQMVIKDTLEQLAPGITVDIAANGKIAVEKVEKGNYDIVLMDVQMLEMDGCEAARFIRNNLKMDIPIIALTASVIRSDLDKCAQAGMNGYIAKPFERDELLKQLIKYKAHTAQVL